MLRLAWCAALLCAFAAPASAQDDDDSKVPPASYSQLPQDQVNQIVQEHQKIEQQLRTGGRGGYQAFRQSHSEVEPYLGLPTDPKQQQLYDQQFGKDSFQIAHRQAHIVLAHYVGTSGDAAALGDGVSKIITGVSQMVNAGLAYAGIKARKLTPEQERPLLEAADRNAVAAHNLLATVPVKNAPEMGGTAEAVLDAAEKRVEDHTNGKKVGTMGVYAKVTSWDHVQQELARNPASPGLNVVAGDQLLANNDPAGAKKYYDNALSIDPGNADALAGRAGAQLDMGNVSGAGQDARDALRIDPQNEGAKAVLALAHDTVGGDVTIDKNNPFKDRGAGDGGATASRGAFGTASGAAPLGLSGAAGLQSSAYTRGALRALELGDGAAALKNADRAISLDPKNADAYGLRAFANSRAGNYPEALRDAVAALGLDPTNTMAHNARAKALNQMGMYHEALAAAEDAIRANPRNAYAYYMKAMALQHIGSRKDVIAALGQAAALDPRYQDAYDLAKSAPDEKDLSFLFPEDQLSAARAALNGQPAGPKRYFWGLTLPMIVGAALVLFGVLHFLAAWLLPRLRGGYAAAVRTGPALDAPTVAAPLPTPPPFSTQRLVPMGTVLRGQYRRLGQIGSSVYGSVYEGMDQALQRRVVIRKLRADMRAADRERLLAPARAAAGLAHAGIAPVYSVFEEGEALYLVSEFAPGRSLRDLLAAKGPLSWEEALPLFRQVADALDYAHGKGVTHGAVKASNLMISAEGRVKLVDFGLARGPADKEADLLALAACLREAIAGLAPARLDAVDAALAKARGQLASAAQVLQVVETGLASAA